MAKKEKVEPRDLREIIENKWPVRFNRRPYDESSLLAFVLDVNDELTLVNTIDEDAGAIGFDVFLNKTVKSFLVYDDPEYYESLVVELNKIRPKKTSRNFDRFNFQCFKNGERIVFASHNLS